MPRYFVMTPEFNRVGSYAPPEYGRDLVEVEADTRRKALVIGLRELKRMGSPPIDDAISDGRTPFGILTIESAVEVVELTRRQTFWAKVELPESWLSKGYSYRCWLWTGGKARGGYGSFHYGLHPVVAHRFAYEDWYGPITNGLELDHLCGTHLCVRPSHLEAVTHLENLRRARIPTHPYTRRLEGTGSVQAAKTHCPHGHPYAEENTYYLPSKNQRSCRTCRRENSKKYYWRQRAAVS